MNILVISDSHGHPELVRRTLDICGELDALLFLGDGCSDIVTCSFPEEKRFIVRGNGEENFIWISRGVPKERLLEFDGVKVLMLHGDKPYNVKTPSGLERTIAYAAEKEVDILLFGHTHSKYNKIYTEGTVICGNPLKKSITVFNPGSIGEARYEAGSFGILTIRDGIALLSHGEIDR